MPSPEEQPETVILADGDYPCSASAVALLDRAHRIVCCDGSVRRFVRRGGMPYAVVGDCDSIGTALRRRFSSILHCDPDQLTNDLTKAVRFCLGKGLCDLTILGATGRREDHTLGNISLLADYALAGARVRMVTDRGVFDPILEDTCFESFSGQQVSIFTLDSTTRITTVGLQYPLDYTPLTGWWQGTLNRSLGMEFTIRTTGSAIVYRLF
jgi:thiamine pyrophosphokinase